MMEKTFDPQSIEARVNEAWARSGAFRAGAKGRENAEPLTIVIPPPNVTGSLHMGHALNNTLQDILCRYWRMKGKDVLWQPGTDHAGIATQMVVERKLAAEGKPDRRTMGREKFLDEVWTWKAESGGTIVNQLKRLGASCDWSRERFTMGSREEGEKGQMQQAVVAFFMALDKQGLLYKDKRLVNWDPKLLTAISDLEVEQREVKGAFAWKRGEVDKEGNIKPFDAAALGKVIDREPGGHLYYFDYPIEGEAYDPENPATYVTVATTRPETMLGDTAVAIHPENEKLKHFIGRNAVLPLVGRLIPIVADDYADPEKGTGAVKITPAHDFNDFDLGKRHALPMVNMLDREGKIDLSDAAFASVPAEIKALAGQPRFEARKRVVAFMESEGRVQKIEPHSQQVPHGDRSGVPIEPWLTEQWYVNVKPLAEKAMEWVRSGQTKILPANREADFFRWMENIEPWCISRQLWWGHQIPAWYGPKKFGADSYRLGLANEDREIFVAKSESEALHKMSAYYGGREIEIVASREKAKTMFDAQSISPVSEQIVPIWRDTDVLDTWFSSALWPFSTLGWPEKTPELAKYYPTSVLVTGFDILFFWVARMMMASAATQTALPADRQAPFKTVYLHGLVRDEKGRKMSKTLGNVIDPLTVIDALGADALRFTLASLAAQGRDPKLGVKTAEGYRNFCTKLWNASRFAEMNECRRVAGFDPKAVKEPLNIWAISEADKALAEIEAGLAAYRFNDAALAAYRFTWNTFCDWYVELAKPALQTEGHAARAETQATTAFLLDRIVAMLHPFMPYITEELFSAYAEQAGKPNAGLLCVEAWPTPVGLDGAAAESEIGFLVDLITEIRSARAEMNVPVATTAPLVFVGLDAAGTTRAEASADVLRRLARVSELQFAATAPAQSVQIVVRGVVACIPLAGIIDFAAEKKRLSTERDKLAKDIDGTMRKLNNPDFMARAPEEVIDENRERVAEAEGRIARIDEALKRLG
ncbi:MAG: valine--tRNA ligase [Rhizobiales bacterium PAR1]|nr:MAG: valine--tRNA ligase [Rhizobiales bacterium PAR1]